MRDYIDVLKLLKKTIYESGYNVVDVATWLRIEPSSAGLYLSGAIPITVEQLLIILDKVYISPNRLFGYRESRETHIPGISAKNQKAAQEILEILYELDDNGIDLSPIVTMLESFLALVREPEPPPLVA
jgi:hypothetical protein